MSPVTKVYTILEIIMINKTMQVIETLAGQYLMEGIIKW